MGLFSHVVAYSVGRRRGRRAAEHRAAAREHHDERDPECLNYQSFCRGYGSCDGMECEYSDD